MPARGVPGEAWILRTQRGQAGSGQTTAAVRLQSARLRHDPCRARNAPLGGVGLRSRVVVRSATGRVAVTIIRALADLALRT